MKNEKLKKWFKRILKDWRALPLRFTNETSKLLERTKRMLLELVGEAHGYFEEFKRIRHDFMWVDIHPFDSGNEEEIAKWHENKKNIILLLENIEKNYNI